MDATASRIRRILDGSELRKHGFWSAAHDEAARALGQQHRAHAVTEPIYRHLQTIVADPAADLFEQVYRQILSDPRHFHDLALWSLYWAAAEAVHELMRHHEMETHEPDLNGAFLSLLAKSIADFPAAGLADDHRFCTGVHLTNNAVRANEASTGSDFGIVVEMRRGDRTIYRPRLIQAKRASGPHVDVHRKSGTSTQLEQLVKHGIGAYLFYNEFGAKGLLPPTAKSAEMVKIEVEYKGTANSLALCDDFPTWLAFGVATGCAVGTREFGTREEALLELFNPEIPGITMNRLLVAYVASDSFPISDVVQLEQSWEALFQRAQSDIKAGRRPFSDVTDPPSPEPHG